MRPEVAILGRSADRLPAGQPVHAGRVQSLLFDGANSAVLLQEARTGREFRIALPQTGQFADLRPEEPVAFSFDPERAVCFAARSVRRLPMPDDNAAAAPAACTGCSARRLALAGRPAWPWTAAGPGAPVAGRADRAAACRPRACCLSASAIGPRQYAASLAQYRTFFTEPLYWHVFVRTAVMSVIATLLTLLLAFPIAWIIAKLARGRASSLLFIVCLIPFWVSETVRTLGWMILLRESGVLPGLLVKLGITAVPVELLYHDATILVGLVYTSLLFMVVPADLQPGEPGQLADRGGLRSRRERLGTVLRTIVIPHAAPGITAGLHRGVHADARQLPDARRCSAARTRSGSPSRSTRSSSRASTGNRARPSAFCCWGCPPPW